MKKVLVVCGQGISSRLFLGEAKRFAETRQVALKFTSTSLTELTSEVASQQDLILLAPQVAYQETIQATQHLNVPTAVIPNDTYGWLNSQSLVKFACEQLKLASSRSLEV